VASKSSGSYAGQFSWIIEQAWWAVKRGNKSVAIRMLNGLIHGQKVYRWYWRDYPDAVAQANVTIADLTRERDKIQAYEG
jgi:hypothetical protein